jgi:hypothetical protein
MRTGKLGDRQGGGVKYCAMFKIYQHLRDRASLGCPGANLKRGRQISQIAANGIHRAEEHQVH